MNIKIIFLGSTAGLIAVSAACAAPDAATVAEPEPIEHVRICDVCGAGYFYIPGTETCLRIGGYIRYDMGFGDIGSFDGAKTSDVGTGGGQDTWRKTARFTMKTWTAQDTELGTLKTYSETRIAFGNRNSYSGPDSPQNYAYNRGITLNFAWIQLGGLRVGRDESAFDTFIGYAGNVMQDTIVPYGTFDTNAVQYYFNTDDGFSALISLEEGSGAVGTIDSFVPHVVGGLKYKQGWGAVTGVVAYDSNYDSIATKVRVDFKVAEELSLFGMVGYGSNGRLNDDSVAGIDAHGRGFYKIWGGNWAFWAGGTYRFNEKISFNLQVSGDQLKNYGVAANIAYAAVPGLTITGEVDYDRYSNFGAITADPSNINWTNANKNNSVGGLLRFQRSF